MILWNLPDKCPQCGCTEVYPIRPQVQVPKPGEMFFVCADESCKYFWKDSVMTSRTIQMYIVHGRKLPIIGEEGVKDVKCQVFVSFATNPEDACKAVGVDGESGDYTDVEVWDLDTIMQGENRVDNQG